jgi:hypothetical protein
MVSLPRVSALDEIQEKEPTYHVTTDGETVRAPVPVRPLVPGCELAAAEDVVRDLLGLRRELAVDFAAVNQQRGFGLCFVFLCPR